MRTMRSAALALALGVALGAAAVVVSTHAAPEAGAVAPADVVGVWRVKLSGDGWLRTNAGDRQREAIRGPAYLALSLVNPEANDRRLRVEVRLPPTMEGSLLDAATPEPAFLAEGYLVGDSMAVIDSGQPNFVNTLTLRFLKDGARVAGWWVAAFPPTSADSGAASAVGLAFAGRRLPTRALGAPSR